MDEPFKCHRYHVVTQNINGTEEPFFVNGTCLPDAFDTNSEERCDRWIFDDNEKTIVNDVRYTWFIDFYNLIFKKFILTH